MKKLLIIALCSTFGFISSGAYASCTSISSVTETNQVLDGTTYKAKRDVCYDTSSTNLINAYDIYATSFSGNKPLVILIHGGGWAQSTTEKRTLVTSKMPSAVAELLDEGYAVASINYKGLTSTFLIDDVVDDAERAVDKVISHSTQNSTNSSKVSLLGTSAGAHLASLLGSTWPIKSKVKGVVGYKGIYELRGPWLGGTVDYYFGQTVQLSFTTVSTLYNDGTGETDLTSILEDAVGSDLDDDGNKVSDNAYSQAQTIALLASPMNYYTILTIPHFFVHGSSDALVPIEQSEDADDKLAGLGVDTELCTVSGSGGSHGALFPDTSSCWPDVVTFLNGL